MLFSRRKRVRLNRTNSLSATAARLEPLESRQMLAGNVLVSLSGDNVLVTGDSLANTIEITALDNDVVIRGLQDTLVNGSANNFVLSTGSRIINGSVNISMGLGNDTVMFSRNVIVNGISNIAGDDGDDQLGSTGVQFTTGALFYGGNGNDTVSLQDSSFGGLLWIKTHHGDDLVTLEDITATGKVKIKTGVGNDAVSLTRVTTAEGQKLSVHTEDGNDDVAVRNSTINGSLKLRTTSGQDAVMFSGNTLNGVVTANLGSGNDNFIGRATNTFNDEFSLAAGNGHSDNVEATTPSNVFNGGRHVSRSEGNTANAAQITSRIDDATTGAIGRANAANNVFNQLLVTSPQSLVLNTSRNTNTAASTGGVVITRNSSFFVDGVTTPLATVTIDSDGDGQFDDGTVTAGPDGTFTSTVTLLRRDLDTGDAANANDQLNGLQTIAVRSTDEAGGVQNASVTVDLVVGTVVQFSSNVGTYEVEMFDALTPRTVANFLTYQDEYVNSIIHRSVTDFVVQGGGFTVAGGVIDNVNTAAPITNEFNSATSNIRGTLAMAQLGGNINSGTSQWFVNLKDNGPSTTTPAFTGLDTVPHTVFGRVIGNGMTVVSAIAAVSKTNLATASGVSALDTVPQRNTFTELTQQLTGTVSTTTGSNVVTGTGTLFSTELTSALGNPGGSRSRLRIGTQTYNVQSIDTDPLTRDVRLNIDRSATETLTNVTANTDRFVDNDFVRFTSISEILDQV